MSVNRVINKITSCVFKNTDKLKSVQIHYNKISSRPQVLVLDEYGNEIVVSLQYFSDFIQIETNAEVYYEVFIY